MNSNLLTELQPNFTGEIREAELLKFHTGFRIGGPARYILIPGGIEDLRQGIIWAQKKQIPYQVMGNGNSVLAHPDGYNGLIIKLVQVLNHIRIQDQKIYAGAGATISALLRQSVSHGLTGLERWWGVSSSIGGWLTRCGLAENPQLDRLIHEVYVMEPDGSISRWIEPSQLFIDGSLKGRTVVEVVFRLCKGESEEVGQLIENRQQEWAHLTQMNLPMVGPIFLPTHSDLTGIFVKAKVSGLQKGKVAFLGIGNGYLANLGGASYADVNELFIEVKERVEGVLGFHLHDGIHRLK